MSFISAGVASCFDVLCCANLRAVFFSSSICASQSQVVYHVRGLLTVVLKTLVLVQKVLALAIACKQ